MDPGADDTYSPYPYDPYDDMDPGDGGSDDEGELGPPDPCRFTCSEGLFVDLQVTD